MTIEDEIRRIAREEIARLFPQHRDQLTDAPIVPRISGAPYKLSSYIINANGSVTYTPPKGKRMGCTCPPGAQTSCPDATCPWKPA